MGWAPTLTWLRWGPQMQKHRKILQPAFSKSQIGQYQDNQRRQALLCLHSLLDSDADWNSAVRRFAVAIVLNISYGIDVEGPDSPWIKIADDAAAAIGNSGAPASSIIDRFPASKSSHPFMTFISRTWRIRSSRHFQPVIFRPGCRLWSVCAMHANGVGPLKALQTYHSLWRQKKWYGLSGIQRACPTSHN